MKLTYEVQRESDYSFGWWDKVEEFDSRNDAVQAAFKEFDSREGDYRVVERQDGETEGWVIDLPAHSLMLEKCGCCGKQVRHMDKCMTGDCHGIPFRWVCPKCYGKLMARGYDGEWYDEADEYF